MNDKEGKDCRRELTDLLNRLNIMPPKPCQIILHCAEGKVSGIELAKLKLA